VISALQSIALLKYLWYKYTVMSQEQFPSIIPTSEPVPKSPEEAGFDDPAAQAAYFRSFIRGQQAASILMQNELHHDATHDALTGVLNLRGFQETVDLMEPDELQNFAVLYGDCTNFKAINDRLGHDMGDEILKATVNVLKTSLRKSSIIGRIGGDEFMALVYVGPWGKPEHTGRRLNQLSAAEQTQRVRDRIEDGMQQILIADPRVAGQGYGLSIGIAHPTPGLSVENLKTRAEAEMMQHKESQHAESGQYRVAGRPVEED
jgi:diguanylate cyclase (GGDEF)-like protein